MTAAAWHPDPTGRHELRYWDGSQWTDHVSDQGVQSTSSVSADGGTAGAAGGGTGGGADPAAANQGYGQGGQGGQGGQPDQQYGQQQYGGQQQVPADAFAGIAGDLIDGRFSEIDGNGPQLQNPYLLRVRITEPFMAQQGSMVTYQGNVNFAYQGGGAAKFLKKALTGEGLSLMRVEGQGDVFLADTGRNVHILQLNNSGLSVNGKNVLAFSASLEWNVERVKGGSIAAGGLFNTTLRGTGWVAITTDGPPVVLNPAEAPTFADANALVAWSTHLQTSIKSSVSAGALIGRGSGEAFQVAFQGPGFVIVQPSEGPQVPTSA
ncbi:Tellurium resistance protein [Nocardioides sp. Root190]|uniref:AIM24 family protein n=1 Tax=Nocardioides sp. Root190 TaxID=1736488 RepID=UPI0006F817A8|nr:AIM24 family protein [Nocardioides sp. Root190]KRB76991.1 Tellurium resistance protein [Nocardioides sp. Root190]